MEGSGLTGKRYSSGDMYRGPDLKAGDRFAVERNGVLYTDMVESVRYSSGSPAIYRTLNRRQRIARRLTPRRWRKSLIVRPAELPSVTINGGGDDDPGWTQGQLEQMKFTVDRLIGQ